MQIALSGAFCYIGDKVTKMKTQAEFRKQAHDAIATAAKEIADTALAAIDAILAEPVGGLEHLRRLEELHTLEGQLQAKVESGEITHAEAEEALNDFINFIESNTSPQSENGLTLHTE